jgi:hypothetical protein
VLLEPKNGNWYNGSVPLRLLTTTRLTFMSGRRQNVNYLFAATFLLSAAVPLCAAEDQAPSIPPTELVRRAVQNEIETNTGSGVHFMFRDKRQTAHLSQTKLIVETREATAGMVVEQDGRPLTPQEKRAEMSRLEAYSHNPEELSKKRKQEKEDADHTEKILKALPDAFLFEPDGTQPGTESVGRAGDQLVKLKFWPNPSYTPPSRVEQVLTGMSGHILVDPKESHIAEIDGTLQREVGFGWGILGHLDRGGRFLVQQADVGDRQWEATRMELSFTGKLLFFKRINIRSTDVFSGFRAVPANLSFAQGVDLLEKECQKSNAQNQEAGTLRQQNLP